VFAVAHNKVKRIHRQCRGRLLTAGRSESFGKASSVVTVVHCRLFLTFPSSFPDDNEILCDQNLFIDNCGGLEVRTRFAHLLARLDIVEVGDRLAVDGDFALSRRSNGHVTACALSQTFWRFGD
jgi:hypothetical protein